MAPDRDVTDVATFWIDRWGAPTTIRDPLNNDTDIIRGLDSDVPAMPNKFVYPNNRIVLLTWDDRANLTQQRDSTEHLTDGLDTSWQKWTYGDTSYPDSPTEIAVGPDSIVTEIAYHSTLGLPDSVTAPNDHLTLFEYFTSGDDKGLVKAVTEEGIDVFDPIDDDTNLDDLRTAFRYDDWGNLVSDTFPNDGYRTLVRDGKQRVERVTDPEGAVTEFEYDVLNRRTKVIQTVEGSVELETETFWGKTQIDSIADPRGVTQRYVYDDGGRLIEKRDEWDNADRFSYDEAGNLLSRVPRHLAGLSDSLITMTYDVMNRQVTKVWPDRDTPHAGYTRPDTVWISPTSYWVTTYTDWIYTIPGDSASFTYDAVTGLMTGAKVDEWEVTRSYYPTGALKRETQKDLATSQELRQDYSYDDMGRRIAHLIGSGSSVDSVWYEYSTTTGELGEIGVEWRTTDKDSVQFTWDDLGRRELVEFSAASSSGNGALEILYSYDEMGVLRRLCSTHEANANATDVFRFRMEHEDVDLNGRLLETQFGDESGDSDCESANWPASVENEYDVRGQLTRLIADGDSTKYWYDHSGNRVKVRHWVGGSETRQDTSLMWANSNRIDLLRRGLDGNPYDTYVDYTLDGSRMWERVLVNTFADHRRFFWFDALGRLSGVQYYDMCPNPLDQDDLDQCRNTLPTACEYGPLGLLRSNCQGFPELPIPFYYDGANIVRTGEDDDDQAWTFVHGPGTDDPLMGMFKAGGGLGGPYYYYWVTDGQGRQYAVSDEGGQALTGPEQWVLTSKHAGGIQNAHSFENSRLGGEDSPGLSFYRNRVYDQNTGKWLQEDPLGVAAGTNLYQYVGNNPASFTDPFGLMPCPPCITDFSRLEHVMTRHMSGVGSGSQFTDMDMGTLKRVLNMTVEGGQQVAERTVGGEVRVTFERTFKSQMGTGGQRVVRVVLGEGGRLVTAFPAKNALPAMAVGTGSTAAGNTLKRGLGGALGALFAVLITPGSLNASPCDDNPSACDP